MESSGYQRWLCQLKIDGMHPQTAPLSAVFYLKFWQNGGISKTKEKNKEAENLRFNLLSRSTNGVKNAGDVFGEWIETGMAFTLVTRQQACKWQFQGRWEEKHQSVPEGRFKVLQDNFRMDTTVGTFKLTLDKSRSKEKKETIEENVFTRNMRQYILNSPKERHFYDFKIVAQDDLEVYSHKIILASQTEYFEALFRQENPGFVKMDFQGDIIKMCVNYLYTKDIDLNGDNVQDVMVFANYVMIMEIVKICEDFIIKNLDQSSCLDVLKLGDYLGNAVIVNEAKMIICEHFQELFSEDEGLKSIPLHLFKKVLSSDKLILYSEYNTILPGMEREEKLARFIEKYCELNSLEKDEESLKQLLRTDKNRLIVTHRELSHLKTFTVSQKMGSAGDFPRHLQSYSLKGEGKKFIRHITLSTVQWDERTIIGGIAFRWSDGSSDSVGSVAEEDSPNRIDMKVPDDEHVSFVFGNSGWYVDCLTFVSSSGKKLGPIEHFGGDGGDFRNPLISLDPWYDSRNTYLDGIECEEVLTQEKEVVTKLRFIYSCLTNGEEPGDELAREQIGDEEEEHLEEMWNMDEDITDSSDEDD